jgi:hypothetical protein
MLPLPSSVRTPEHWGRRTDEHQKLILDVPEMDRLSPLRVKLDLMEDDNIHRNSPSE